MQQSAVEKLKVSERINALVINFGTRPTWTPAEGAMLVCGIRPPSHGARTIPKSAMQLIDEVIPATQSQLLRAGKVLESERPAVPRDVMAPR
jgi:hypothetical protein